MEVAIRKVIRKIKEAKRGDQIQELFQEVNHLLKSNPTHLELLHNRAELNIKRQELGAAINDYRMIIAIDKNDKKASAQIEQLQTILKYNNTDIYANPNTNFDPWID